MKKLVLLLAVIFTANVMMAQDRDCQDAFVYNRQGNYEKAVKSIEKCLNHENFLGMKANKQAKAWLYCGTIYLNVHQDPELAAKYPNALERAYEALANCIKADPDYAKDNAQEVYPRIAAIAVNYFQDGVTNFNNQVFPTAATSFRKSYEISLSGANPDTVALVNSALSYMRAEMYEDAIKEYTELKDLGYNHVDLYKNMATCYGHMGEQEKSAEIIEAGLQKFPGDAGMIIEKVNVYLRQGKGEEAIADINRLQELDPNNPSILFILGTIYGDEKNDIFDGQKAIDYYMQAINLNPNYYDAIYNLGAMYITLSNKLKAEANEITGFSKAEIERYDSLVHQAEELVRTGLPYVKQAYEAQPADDIKQVLKSMYVQLNMLEEAKALDAQ